MFKINIYLKLGLIALSMILGIVLTFSVSFWYALPFFILGLILVVSYFLFGTIMSTSEYVQKQQFGLAAKQLNLTIKPNWLYKTNRAFYYILKGSLALQRKETQEAEGYFKKAKEINLPTDNEKAMVELQLAGIQAQRNNWKAVKNSIQRIKKLNITESQIKEQLLQFEQGAKNAGGLQTARQMNKGRLPSMSRGKRRRPRMK